MPKPITRVVLFHGYAGTPDRQWFPWLHAEIEKLGIAVTAPAMPSPLHPRYKDWLKTVKPLAAKWDEQTLIVAHSLGGVIALRALEKYAQRRVAGVLLISSPFTSLINVKQLVEFFEKPIDWPKVRAMSATFAVLHAKDDPLVPHDHGIRYAEALGADLRILPKGGHLNGKKIPLLLAAIKRHL